MNSQPAASDRRILAPEPRLGAPAAPEPSRPIARVVADPVNHRRRRRINLDPDDVKNGLAQLVLTLVKLLHELMEKQAIRRIESGSLNEAECERLGFTLMKQSEQIDVLREAFGLSEQDLNVDLGPLGKLV